MSRSRAGRALWVLVATLLAAGGALAWLVVTTGGAREEQAAREEVLGRAEQFALRLQTFDPTMLTTPDRGRQPRMPSYRSLLSTVVTPKLQAAIEHLAMKPEAAASQLGTSSAGAVYASGVESLDADSATVLLVGEATAMSPTGQPAYVPYRFRIEMVEIDGQWLVDDCRTVEGQACL